MAYPAAVPCPARGACGALTGGLIALSAKRGRDRDKLDKGRFINNFKKGQELVETLPYRVRPASPARNCNSSLPAPPMTCGKAEEYQAFNDARGDKCARATATVTKWVVEMM